MKRPIISRKALKRGATMHGFSLEIQAPSDITFVAGLCQLRTADDQLVHEFAQALTPTTIEFLPADGSITQNFPLGELRFDVKIETSDGIERVPFEGTQKIMHTWSRHE